jgi:adenosylcobinamide kinase / adenosylcobinamide-phosphate guanylyltransferase
MRELILGGQKSGKSRRAEDAAAQWLAASPAASLAALPVALRGAGHAHEALLLATALAGDGEMRQRIARHQADRVQRVPGLRTLEVPLDLASAIAAHSAPHRLLVIDCLTLWLTNWLMPLDAAHTASSAASHHAPSAAIAVEASTAATEPFLKQNQPIVHEYTAQAAMFLRAIELSKGPIVIVTNEIGLGVIPLGPQVRGYVDALGNLNQSVARVCDRVTLMAAGLPLHLKGA